MYSHCPLLYCAASDVWVDKPTSTGIILYSVITPVLALFGFIGNLLSLCILTCCTRMNSSTTTYLAVLAMTDLAASAFLLVSGLCRGILWSLPGWREYEAIIAIPFGGMFTCWAATAIVAVTFDRIVYLWRPTRTRRPAFCQPKVARLVMLGGLLISILFNLPYCFIYTWDCNGNLVMTEFVTTTYYSIHNWTKLIIFSVLPALLLLIGNIFLVRSLKKMYKMQKECLQRCNKIVRKNKEKKWVTVTLVLMIFSFLIGEIPANLVSRSSVVTLIFWGDEAKADSSKTLEFFRQVATLMNGVYLAANFLIYYMFCTNFRGCFRDIVTCRNCCRRSDEKPSLEESSKKDVRLMETNIFIVDEHSNTKSLLAQINWSIVRLFDENKLASNIVTSVKIY